MLTSKKSCVDHAVMTRRSIQMANFLPEPTRGIGQIALILVVVLITSLTGAG